MSSFVTNVPENCETAEAQRSYSFSSTLFCSESIYNSPLSQSFCIPFLWEQEPGIPKRSSSHPHLKTKSFSTMTLPLPPARRKSHVDPKSSSDPFIIALLKCSRDQASEVRVSSSTLRDRFANEPRVSSRTLSDRFGFINVYAYCKNSCDVIKSNVVVPRSRQSGNFHRCG
ncbi:hypothetical protein GIB67_026269 [Kingdonia uniflora]|uniref:Uncharacterized protein n=1 Tax=Kingdonia uniflora TaxID=39325 RepID=A0A7J7L9V0_9MAGN|nr:hypothetical protein GIB67_026269 [Kingdonia uniflora]